MALENEQKQRDEQEFYQLFQTWRQTIGYTFRRRFLEVHPRLVGAELDALAAIDALHQDEGFRLLQQIRQRGGSQETIREIFVDYYGGLALDLPPWLEEVEDRYYDLRYSQEPLQHIDERIGLLSAAIQRGTDDKAVAPETLADLLNKLAIALKEHPLLDRPEAIENALALHKAALQVFQFERYPRQWAIQQVNLGNAYGYRIKGVHRQNMEKAIAHFTAALQVYTLAAFPQHYATTLTNLGIAYQDRIEGTVRENIELSRTCLLAALRVRIRRASPVAHAATLHSLGEAYQQRQAGNRVQNKEKALCCHQAALSIYTQKHLLLDQARVWSSLGRVYRERLVGVRRGNQEQAIRYLEQALSVYTPDSFPLEYALAQVNLGMVYDERHLGTRRDNQEEAILCFTRALAILHPVQSPLDYAEALQNLGSSYRTRIKGDRRANLEQAITCYTQVLQIRTREQLPQTYAATQNNLGGVYWHLSQMPGRRSDQREAAIRAYQEALEIYQQADLPVDCALVQGNLGVAYLNRFAGKPEENQEKAIRYFKAALRVYTETDYPREYAAMQDNLGLAYWQRIRGKRRTNLTAALAAHTKALETYTLEDFPFEYRNVHLNIASLAFEQMIPDALRSGKKQLLLAACTLAHQHYAQARQAQQMLGWLESDEQGRASLQGFYFATREMYAREAWCLWKLGKLSDAALVLESGRVQALVEARALAGTVLAQVCSEHAAKFETARQNVQRARLEDDRVQKRVARDELLRVRQAIQCHCQPDFLADLTSYQEIVNATSEHTLIYLSASQHGGFALLIPPASADSAGAERLPIALSLPALTWEKVDEWIITHAGEGGVCGGYQFALRRQGLELLLIWLAAGDDPERYERLVALPLNQILHLLPDRTTSLSLMLADTLRLLTQAGEKGAEYHLDQALQFSLDTWLIDDMLRKLLQQCLSWSLQKREIASVLQALSTNIMEPLRAWLEELEGTFHCSPLACIPCGRLGIFPLHAAPTGPEQLPFAERFEMTYQASARVLSAVRQTARMLPTHGPVLAVGDPQHIGAAPLPCAQAEIEAIVLLANQAQPRPSTGLSGARATNALFLKKLAEIRQIPGAWLHIASHGQASVNDPQNSYMELSGFDAQGQKARLSLAALQHEQLLTGLWGVTASGCVTGLADLEIAPDELGSFAAGLLQAGAVCVVATPWPVSDHATALLMVRFHQVRFAQPSLSTAMALREAVHWLRTAPGAELDAFARAWHLPELSATHLVRHAVRGAELPAYAEKGPGEHEAFFPPLEDEMDAEAKHLPYHHPVYWAFPILYGM